MKYYPGKRVPFSGIYDERNMFGVRIDQITLIKDHLFPPILNEGDYYELYMEAKHRTLEKKTAMQLRKKEMKEKRLGQQRNDN